MKENTAFCLPVNKGNLGSQDLIVQAKICLWPRSQCSYFLWKINVTGFLSTPRQLWLCTSESSKCRVSPWWPGAAGAWCTHLRQDRPRWWPGPTKAASQWWGRSQVRLGNQLVDQGQHRVRWPPGRAGMGGPGVGPARWGHGWALAGCRELEPGPAEASPGQGN